MDGWSDLRDRFVAPFYLHCLNGNLVSLESDELQQLVQDMREVHPISRLRLPRFSGHMNGGARGWLPGGQVSGDGLV